MQNKILQILKESMINNWEFPQTYKAFKEIGLKTYTVDVPTFKMSFVWDEGEYIRPSNAGFSVSGDFSSFAIKNAIDIHNKNKTTFIDFMVDIASVGCYSYTVEFDNDQVVYYNESKGSKHIEKVIINE